MTEGAKTEGVVTARPRAEGVELRPLARWSAWWTPSVRRLTGSALFFLGGGLSLR